MKKLLSILLVVCLIVVVVPLGTFTFTASAATSGTTGDCTWSLDGTVLTISGNGTMANYTYYNVPWGCDITEVIIEKGVTSIGSRAFSYCTNLESITIPNSVTSIGSQAFSDCTNLESITIPNSVTSIGNYAFYNCTSLESITIPDSVTSIGEDAFSGCTSLESVTIGDGVTSIDWHAFSNCTSLESITIPNSVTSIGNYAFYNCTSLTSITVDEDNAFYSSHDGVLFNKNKLELITYPASKAERNYNIPDSVTSIDGGAFSGCTSLESITIPDSVTSIGYSTFEYCTSLESITIPDSVTSIGNYAFYNCTSLTSITVDEDNAFYSSHDGVLFNKNKSELITYPAGKAERNYNIPNSVTSIGNSAFYNCTSLKTVTIGDSVTSIGYEVFENCTSLESITIPDSVTSIGYEAFENCTSLESITIPDSVKSIGNYAFEGCTSLTSITVDEDNAFYSSHDGVLFNKNKSELITYPAGKAERNYNIPNSVTSIGNSAFYNCTSLKTVTIGDSVTSIGWCAFSSCTNLKTITLSKNTTNINTNSFNGCDIKTIYFKGARDEWEDMVYCDDEQFANAKIICICKGEHTYTDENDTSCNNCEFVKLDISTIFPDTANNGWYSNAVRYVYENGIMSGYSNGKFGTSDGIQRQDFLVMLARYDGVDLTQYEYDCNMPDVARDSYYESAVNWGVEKGITTGYESGKFGVGDKITREQLVTFLYRYAKYKNIEVENVTDTKAKAFPDYNKVTDFAEAPIIWAIDKGVINGKSGYIAPQGNAQRCEIAQIMYNIFQKDIF